MLLDQHEHRVHRRMRAAAARILLDADTGLHDVLGEPQSFRIASSLNIPAPLNTIRKPCLCSNAPALAVNPSAANIAANKPLREQWPTCSGFVMVPKFALMLAASEAASPSADGDALWRQPHDLTARRGGAEHAQSRRRVPAFLVMVRMHAAADARLGLKAGDEGSDECASVNLRKSAEREQRRQQRHGRMPTH